MKYTIVIPTYNNKYHLADTLRALLDQKNHAPNTYEIIVVDDGSSDGLFDYISDLKLQLNLKFIRLERDAFSCRARARNIGWKHAAGEYIVFIDSDILVKEDHLLQLDRYFDANSKCVVVGNRLHIRGNFNPAKVANIFSADFLFPRENYSVLDYRYLVFSSQSYNGSLIPESWLHTYSCNIAVAKQWLVQANGFDEKFIDWGLEDVELGYRLHLLGLNISINPYLEVFHQGCGHRDDLAISQQRLKKYTENINYFLHKHPTALSAYQDPVDHLINGQHFEPFDFSKNNLLFEFHTNQDIESFKRDIAEAVNNNKAPLVILDYSVNSNLDVWVQSLSLDIYYFPMSRVIDAAKMQDFIHDERRKVQASQHHENQNIQMESALN